MRGQSRGCRIPHGSKVIKLNIDPRGLVHFGKMSGGYFITTFVNNAIPILVLPVLTRFLAPEQYANVTLFCFYLALVNALTGVSIQTVIAKNFYDADKKQFAMLVGNLLLIVLAFSAAIMLLLVLSHPILKRYFDLGLFWLMLIPATSFAFSVFSTGLAVLRHEKKVLGFGKQQVGNTAINIAISLVLVAVLLWGWQGRVWGIIIANFISALWMYGYLKANGYVSFVIAKAPIKSILAIVLPLIPNAFQSIVISQVGIFFIQFYFSKKLLGIYAVGFQVAYAIELLKSALELSWSPYLYEQLANTKAVNRMYLTRMLLTLFAIMALGVVFMNVFSGIILASLTSRQYSAAGDFIPWFTLGFFFHGLYVFLMPFLLKFEKQRYVSLVSFANMILMILLNVMFVNVFGYIGIAYAFAVIYFLMFLALAWKAQQVFPLPWLRAIKIWN